MLTELWKVFQEDIQFIGESLSKAMFEVFLVQFLTVALNNSWEKFYSKTLIIQVPSSAQEDLKEFSLLLNI